MNEHRNVRANASTHEKLKRIADYENRTIAAIIRRMVDDLYQKYFGTKKTWNDENENIKQNQGRS